MTGLPQPSKFHIDGKCNGLFFTFNIYTKRKSVERVKKFIIKKIAVNVIAGFNIDC